jgi:Glycosyl hydrolases family 28
MTNSTDKLFSRRKWLGLAAKTSLGSGLLAVAGTPSASQTPATSTSTGHDLGARIYNIRDFGAKGDGTTLDTAAVQAAIDACNRDQGGTVLVPAGVFVIGTAEMKSNVTLHIAAQGKLLGSGDGKQYHAAEAIPLSGDSTLGDGNVGLIFAVNAENITIEGPGTIDGQGAQFRSPERGVPPPSGRGGAQRPYHLLFHRCKNLTVRDIFLYQSAFHSVRIIQSSFVKLDGIRIYNRVNHNNDGFHFISAEHVHLSNCTVECQDDACALFGSCKFVTVTNCSFSTRWSVFRFGGGVAENITVSNCLIYETFGCPIKMRCGPGSRFENISFSNLVMKNVTGPISIGVGPQQRRPQTTQPGATSGPQTSITKTNNAPEQPGLPAQPGIVRNISFSGIHATVAVPQQFPDVPFTSGYNPGEIKSCIALNGVEGILEKITFSDVQVTFPGGGTAEEAAVRDVPRIVGEYYQAGVYPAYALYARNARGITLSNVRFEVEKAEARPAVVFDHVTDASVNGFNVQGTKEAESLLRFIETRDVLLTASRVLAPTPVYLQVEGAGSQGITIDGGDLSKAGTPLAFKAGAQKNSVKLRA